MQIGSTTVGAGGPGLNRERVAVLGGFAAYLILVAWAWWGVTHALPDRLSFSLMGHGIQAAELHRRITTKGLVLALILPVIFLTEMSFVGWSASSIRHLIVRRTPSSMTDLAVFLLWQTPLMTLLAVIMSLGVAMISGAALHEMLRRTTGLDLSVAGAPIFLQVLTLFVVYSFLDYWNHRLDHTAWFWPLHRFHHAADDFDVLNSARTHPAAFTGVINTVLPAALLSAAPSAVVDVALFVMGLRYVIHSRIDSNFGWIGQTLLQSPNHHRRHHSLDTTEPTGHFSLVPIWDHLFGTWRGDADQSLPIGVAKPYRHGLWVVPDMLSDYADFWKGLVGAREPARASADRHAAIDDQQLARDELGVV